MLKLNSFFNSIIRIYICVFIGRSLFIIVDYNYNPNIYMFDSAPWYTRIILDGYIILFLIGICMIAKYLICMIAKYLIRKRLKRDIEKS